MTEIKHTMGAEKAILDTLLDTIRDAVVLADADRRPNRLNKAFENVTGHSYRDVLNRATDHGSIAHDLLIRALAASEGGRWRGYMRCADGTDRHVDITVSPVDGTGYPPAHFVGLVRPTGGHETLDSREEVFGHDLLTGLPNRDIFYDRVNQAVLQTNRGGGSVALLMMGLDHFTLVNDALGHAAGDQLLIEVARRLRNCSRETDTVARLDGDKFALVMAIGDVDDSVIVAEKVLSVIGEPFHIGDHEVVVNFSIGIALHPQDAPTGPQLIKQAENALHYAKVSGRNQYRYFSKDMNQKAKARLDIESRIRKALANEEFTVFYQPKVRADDNVITGAEALVRWIDPERGVISPLEFIPVAEENGLIEQLGAWVLTRACQENKAWQDQGIEPMRVSVNVSARQFRGPHFVETVEAILRDTGLAPRWLELEITESVLMQDVEAAIAKMTALRAMGIGLSIDDFGTGYSSLSYLCRFPITTLKIDRAFIADVDTNPKMAEVARAIIGLSKGLDLEVVAEGCEVAEHVAFLKEHGCQTVQGFYYSKPLPATEFERMLRAKVVQHEPARPARPVRSAGSTAGKVRA